ncbi:MAG: hypothetical protein ACXU7D_08580 [Burkholderiaceae bacterium]
MKKIVFIVVILTSTCANLSYAGPGDYVASTYDNDGQLEIDFKFGNVGKAGQEREREASFGLGYGVTRAWFTELYIAYARNGDNATQPEAYSWLNAFLLTHGQLPYDIGLYTEIERPRDHSEGYALKFGPMLQTDIGKTQLNVNLFVDRNYQADVMHSMQMSYQWQAKYRWHPKLQPGLQGFGELGKWDHWAPRNQQSHRFGPALFGTFELGGKQVLRYDVAYLIDANDAQHSKTFRTRIQYEF